MIIKFLILVLSIFSLYFLGFFFFQKFYKLVKVSNNYITASESIIFGLFLWGSFVFIFNFFYKINSIFFIFLITIIFLFIFLQFKNYQINKYHLKNILIFSLISFPLVLTMDPGYDAGLYHVTHQKIIREEKIVFGIANLHNVLGFASLYEYLSAPLWVGNNLDNLANVQVIFYISFFLFLYETAKKDIKYSIFILFLIISIPFWSRYAPIKWGLVDFPFGIVLFLSILTSTLIISSREKKKTEHLLFVLIILNCLTFFLKPGGFAIGLLTFLIVFYLINKNLLNFKFFIKLVAFPFVITSLWILRSFINTSCLLYPFSISCINTKWGNALDANFNWIVTKEWGQIIFQIINENINFSYTFLIFFLFVFLLLFILFHNLISKRKPDLNLTVFYTILIIVFGSELIFFNKITDFSRSSLTYEKILYELLNFLILFLIYYSLLIIFFGLKKINSNIINVQIIPLCFSMLLFLSWILSAPIPRLGFSIIAGLFFTFLCFMQEQNIKKTNHQYNINLILIFIFCFTISNSFVSNYRLKKLHISSFTPPEIITIPRKGFGIKPIDGDQCWDEMWCSPLEPYILKMVEINSYKFLIKDN